MSLPWIHAWPSGAQASCPVDGPKVSTYVAPVAAAAVDTAERAAQNQGRAGGDQAAELHGTLPSVRRCGPTLS
jgi:hypothetical protein